MKSSMRSQIPSCWKKLILGAIAAATVSTSLPAFAQFRGPSDGGRGGWGRPDRGPDRWPDRGPGRGGWDRPGRGPGRGPDRGPGRGPDRGPDRGPGGGWERPPGRPPGPPPRPPGPPPPVAQLLNIYRFMMPQDHLFTLDANEGYRAGYQAEGVGFQTFAYSTPGVQKAPIYRCYVYGVTHFVSRDPNCEGQIQEGSLGLVAVQPSYEAGRELIRCTGPVDHLATTNIQECYNAGYRIEGVLGYVP